MNIQNLLIFTAIVIGVWSLVIYFWPGMLLSAFKKGFLSYGLGDGPVPTNTLCTQPEELFANPLNAPASAPKVITSGVNHDTLLTAGWLDLSKGSQVLHVPDMNDRYYSVQFTDPTRNTVFAYVGKRTTGTGEGDYLITGPGWKGQVPDGLKQIASPKNGVMLIGRVFVADNSDLPAAYDLSTQIQLTPLSNWQTNQ